MSLGVSTMAQNLQQCDDQSEPANTRRWTNVGLMLGQRRRRWANIKPTLVQRLVLAGEYKKKDRNSNPRHGP